MFLSERCGVRETRGSVTEPAERDGVALLFLPPRLSDHWLGELTGRQGRRDPTSLCCCSFLPSFLSSFFHCGQLKQESHDDQKSTHIHTQGPSVLQWDVRARRQQRKLRGPGGLYNVQELRTTKDCEGPPHTSEV